MSWINLALLEKFGLDTSTADELSPFVMLFTVPGDSAAETWMDVKDHASDVGGWPVILGDPENRGRIAASLSLKPTPAETLSDVPTSHPLAALAEGKRRRHTAMLEHFKSINAPTILIENIERQLAEQFETPEAAADFSSWPSTPQVRPFALRSTHNLVSGQPLKTCLFGIVRTTDPAEVPAYLHFGGWNDCPPPNVQVAILRGWQNRYGAIVAAATSDVLELYVSRPILDRDEAFRVAVLQEKYCGDIVSQGTQTVDALARSLWGSPVWFFWWD